MNPDELAVWQERLTRWEAQRIERSPEGIRDLARLGLLEPGLVELQHLPHPAAIELEAEPVRETLQRFLDDPLWESGPEVMARGFGLDEELVTDILDGRTTSLDLEQIRAVCEGLKCSPYDMWGPEGGRAILDVYPPDQWPRYIESLDDTDSSSIRPIAPADEFVARRLAQLAPVDLRELEHDRLATVPLVITPYVTKGVLALDRRSGRMDWVEDTSASADPAAEYHLAFAQLTRPRAASLLLPDGHLPDAAPPGHDAPPALAEEADQVRAEHPNATLVRFTSEQGDEHWVGLDPQTGTWATWDHPGEHFPGPSAVVLDAGSFPEPTTMLPADPLLEIVREPAIESFGSLSVGIDF